MKVARGLAVVVSCGVLAVLSSGCDVDARPPVEGAFDRTLAVNGPVDLDIRSGSGSVQIDTGAADAVHVVARIRASTWFTSDPEERVRRIEATPPIEQSGNTIRIGRVRDNDLYRNISISYEVTVPEDTRVRSRVGSGRQTISHLRGPVDVSTGSGSVRVGQVTGDVQATTGSGSIDIEDAGGRLEARTGSGTIAIAGVRRMVRARTGSGGIRIEGQPLDAWDLQTGSGGIDMRVMGETPFDLDARSGSGGIESTQPVSGVGATSRRRLQGRVRGGGAPVQLVTGSGGIRIQ
jgi:hypothetical protein